MMKKSSLRVVELSDSFEAIFCDWSDYDIPCCHIDTPNHKIFGFEWSLRVYPNGCWDDSDTLAAKLVNNSTSGIEISYILTLVNQTSEANNIAWSDPEDLMKFEGVGGNNEWGAEDLIPLSELNNKQNGFVVNNTVIFRVYMEVYDVVDIDSYPLTKAIENSADTKDLLKLADEDLSHVIDKVPLGKQNDVNKQQDNLLRYRFSMTPDLVISSPSRIYTDAKVHIRKHRSPKSTF